MHSNRDSGKGLFHIVAHCLIVAPACLLLTASYTARSLGLSHMLCSDTFYD